MAHFTLIARLSDGLPLCESADSVPLSAAGAETCKGQAKAILKRLEQRSPSRLSIESGAFTFNYAIEEGIAFLVMTDAAFPKRLTFTFLADVHREFVGYMRETHGEAEWRSRIDTAAQPYASMGFTKILSRLRREYADPSTKSNAARIADELHDVRSIMRQNITEVLDRGEKLDNVSRISSRLVSESKSFKWGAKKLNLWAKWAAWAPWGGALLLISLLVWWRFR